MKNKLQELETKVWNNMGNLCQITIDLVQDAEQDCEDEDWSAEAYSYKVSCVLDIADEDRVKDIEILQELLEILEKK